MLNLKSLRIENAKSFKAFTRDALEADWACYTTAADKVEPARLEAVIRAFPEGFQIYYQNNKPIGYTGWHPVPHDIFSLLHDTPHELTHRGQIMPLPERSSGGDYLYLFNYSIIPSLQKTPTSRALLQSFAREVKSTPHKGLAAVTVSPDGARVAERFGMNYRGNMTHDGEPEGVYALRLL